MQRLTVFQAWLGPVILSYSTKIKSEAASLSLCWSQSPAAGACFTIERSSSHLMAKKLFYGKRSLAGYSHPSSLQALPSSLFLKVRLLAHRFPKES